MKINSCDDLFYCSFKQEFINVRDIMDKNNKGDAVEVARAAIFDPLFRRLDAFLNTAKPKLASLKDKSMKVKQSVEDIMIR